SDSRKLRQLHKLRRCPAYRPGLGGLVVGSIEPRHIKLGLAGKAKNWAYVSYRLHELQESFDRVAQNFPQSMPLGDMMVAATKGPMGDLAAAVTDKDEAKYTSAYAALTDGCNSCRRAMNRAAVVIKVPDTSSFPDQDFAPSAQ
ncbi:MAG TPA: hypothetical protein VG271_15280, partial [Beijerinckiaceae bacterium]|nr:hypothetical protein [Beijerinckiaceae bacterium]